MRLAKCLATSDKPIMAIVRDCSSVPMYRAGSQRLEIGKFEVFIVFLANAITKQQVYSQALKLSPLGALQLTITVKNRC